MQNLTLVRQTGLYSKIINEITALSQKPILYADLQKSLVAHDPLSCCMMTPTVDIFFSSGCAKYQTEVLTR